MGLDMYLNRKKYVKNWEFKTKKHTITVKENEIVDDRIKPERITYVVEEVAYWRKFNALHGWFIQNCADGVDDCREVYVPIEKLKELLTLLKEVQNSFTDKEKVEELLPPTTGFFFGSSKIDESYEDDVNETVTELEKILSEVSDCESDFSFYYKASW